MEMRHAVKPMWGLSAGSGNKKRKTDQRGEKREIVVKRFTFRKEPIVHHMGPVQKKRVG